MRTNETLTLKSKMDVEFSFNAKILGEPFLNGIGES